MGMPASLHGTASHYAETTAPPLGSRAFAARVIWRISVIVGLTTAVIPFFHRRADAGTH